MYNFNYGYMLFEGSMLYHHLLCPVLTIITFIFFDHLKDISKKDTIRGLYLTFIYAIILIILNLIDIIVGPYPFLMIKKQSIMMSVIWFIVIIGFAYLISISLRKLYLKYNKTYS